MSEISLPSSMFFLYPLGDVSLFELSRPNTLEYHIDKNNRALSRLDHIEILYVFQKFNIAQLDGKNTGRT